MEKDRVQWMLGAASRWEKVLPKAVVSGSSTQAENVLADAIHDIACLWRACKKAQAENARLREALQHAEKIVRAAAAQTETDHIGDVWKTPLAEAAEKRLQIILSSLNGGGHG